MVGSSVNGPDRSLPVLRELLSLALQWKKCIIYYKIKKLGRSAIILARVVEINVMVSEV